VDNAIILTKPNNPLHGLDLRKQSSEGLAEYLGIDIKRLEDS